jgi:hypothetical protein
VAIDQSKIGQVVTAQMEAIEEEYGDEADSEIGAVITIVQVVASRGESVSSEIRMRCNVEDPYMILGIMRAAEQTVIQGFGGDEGGGED